MIQQNPGSPKNQLRAFNIMFLALVIFVLIFLAITIYLLTVMGGGVGDFDNDVDKYFLAGISVIAIICLVAGTINYKRRLQRTVKMARSLDEKLENYRATMIIYLASCEGPAIFSVMGLFLTGNYWFILITAIMLTAMITKRPMKQRLTNDLQLNSQEQQQFD